VEGPDPQVKWCPADAHKGPVTTGPFLSAILAVRRKARPPAKPLRGVRINDVRGSVLPILPSSLDL
jgi:hypothetical protein